MKIINVHEAKTKLSSILGDIEKGDEYLICRNGIPVADLVPHKKRKRTKRHPIMRRIEIKYDPIEPLSDEEWGPVEL